MLYVSFWTSRILQYKEYLGERFYINIRTNEISPYLQSIWISNYHASVSDGSETPATGFCSYCNRGRLWAFLMQISDPLDIRRRVKLFSLWWYRIPLGNGSVNVARHKNVGLEKGLVSFCMWYRGEEHQAPVGARGVEGVCDGGGMLHDYPYGLRQPILT